MKADNFLREIERIDEAGIKNIRKKIKGVKKAVGYGHMDTDGITSSIGFKAYLEGYGVKTVDWHPIQYGEIEFAVPNPPEGYLNWIVDFAHTKGNKVNIWLDHHSGEHKGAGAKTSVKFSGTRSNIEDIQTTIAIRDIFPPRDLEIISTVDSADFYSHGLTPDDIMRAAFGLNKDISVKDNHWRMGLVVNKLLLSYKNKPDFLKKLVKNAKPSLISMYNVIRRIAKQEGYRPPEEIEQHQQAYVKQQKEDIVSIKSPKAIEFFESGESAMLGDVVVQYGGGQMFPSKGLQYDRYVVFKNHPDANFLVIGWPLGLVQASANPFKKKTNTNLIDIVLGKVVKKYESKWRNKMISLEHLKGTFEKTITKKNLSNAIGFTFDDLINTFGKGNLEYENIDRPMAWKIVQNTVNIKHKDLTDRQKNILRKVKVSLWDVIMAQSGGHPSIVNLTNLNFIGKDYVTQLKKIMADIAAELNKL